MCGQLRGHDVCEFVGARLNDFWMCGIAKIYFCFLQVQIQFYLLDLYLLFLKMQIHFEWYHMGVQKTCARPSALVK